MAKNEDLRVLTIAGDKGGVTKTTTAHNYGEWLASEGYSVLLIDQDRSLNLTRRYALGEAPSYFHTVMAIYDGLPLDQEGVQPIEAGENIDLIGASSDIPDLEARLTIKKVKREMVLFNWLAKNYEALNASYDYIVIDTRNDDGNLTTNAMAASNVIIALTDISVDGYEALFPLKSTVLDLNEGYDLDIKLLYVAAGIAKGETSTKELLPMLKKEPEFIGAFRRNTAMANPETMVARAKADKNFGRKQDFFLYELFKLYGDIKEVLDHD